MAFGKTLEFPVLLGVGERRNGLRDFEFKEQRQMRPTAPPKHLRSEWPQFRADRRGRERSGQPGGARAEALPVRQRSEAGSPGVRGDWGGPGIPQRRGKGERNQVLLRPWALPGGTEKKKEDAAGKRGAGAGAG